MGGEEDRNGSGQGRRLWAGDLLERYVLLKQLAPPVSDPRPGRRFLAYDRASLEDVMLALVDGDEAGRDEFLEGLQVARGVVGRGLATVLAGGSEESRPLVVSSWTPGVRLLDLLAEGGLPEEAASRLLRELCDALTTLHASGLAHGDIRPGNVIVTPDGDPVLVGFVPAPFQSPLATWTEGEAVHRYAAPEWHASREATPEGDIYSLALVAFEMFTGRPLLPAGTVPDTLGNQARLQGALQKSRTLARTVPQALNPALLLMLEQDPSCRPRLELGLAGALMQFLPSWALDRGLEEVLGDYLLRALARVRAALLNEARRELQGGRCMAAATAVKRYAELGAVPPEPERELVAELVRACLWLTLTPPLAPGDSGDGDARARGEAVCMQLLKAAIDLRLDRLATVARHRLRAFADEDSAVTALAATDEEREQLVAQRPSLREMLRKHMAFDDALLGLAIQDEGFRPREGAGLNEMRAELLARHDMPAAALFHFAREIPRHGENPIFLGHLEELARRAREVGEGRTATGTGTGAGVDEAHAGSEESEEGVVIDFDDTGELGELGGASLEGLERGLGEAAEVEGGRRPITRSQGAVRRAGVLGDAEVLFTQGQVLLSEGRLEEAAEVFLRLAESGALGEEHFHAVLCDELRRLLWTGLLARPVCEEIGVIWESALSLARSLELPAMVALCAYLAEVPREEAGLPAPAGEEADREWAASSFEAGSLPPAEQLRQGEAFLREHPGHLPALEATLLAAERARDRMALLRCHQDLGRERMLRGARERAREHFRLVLLSEPGNDEALLHLAALDDPGALVAEDLLELRILALRREGLERAAIFHARKALRGGERDMPIHRQLIDLCRVAGEDPSPHLVAVGHQALLDDNESLAAQCFRDAVREAANPPHVVDTLHGIRGIVRLFSEAELDAFRSGVV